MSEYLILHFKIPEDQSVSTDISNEVIDIYHSKDKHPDNGTNNTYKNCTKYSFNGTQITQLSNTGVDINIEPVAVAGTEPVAEPV